MNQVEDKKQSITKVVIAQYPDKFEPKALVDDAINAIIYNSRGEAITQIRKLIEGKYYLTKEISVIEKKLDGLKRNLEKKTILIAEVEKGNFDVLFKKDQTIEQPEPARDEDDN